MRDEWSILVKLGINTILVLIFLGIVSTIVAISYMQANKQIAIYADKISYEDFSEYNNKVVDSPVLRNILRSNKERIQIYLENTSNPISEDPATANLQIKNFLNRTTYRITVTDTGNENTIMIVHKL